MRARTLLVLLSLLALAAVAPAAAVARCGGSDRPFKGSASLVSTFNLVTTSGTAVGKGHFTHMGKVTMTQHDLALTPTADPATFIFTGANTRVAANRDQLFSTFAGTLVAPSTAPGSTGDFKVTETITGGTGRFAHARGTATASGIGVIKSLEFPILTVRVRWTTKGTISF